MKKIITLILLIAGISQSAFTQQKNKGYQVVIDEYGKNVYNITYTRTSYSSEGYYFTVYNVYNLKGRLIIEVKAKHQKNAKKVTVEVRDPNGGVFSRINTEEGDYEIPSLEPFGNTGNYRILGGNDFPPQLSLKFMSNKYENVKVISVNATRPSTQTFVFYVFANELGSNKENNKTTQSKTTVNNNLFQGTKIFVDKDQIWKNVVTIDKNIFTIQSYPGKNNNLYKNKNIPQSTESGYIKNGKIYTRSADNTYLPDLYKYEFGKFYELNNENEYNDYFELNSVNSTSLSNSYVKSDPALEETPIALRKFTNLVIPQDDGQKNGKIAVQIKINKKGIVVDATPGVKGTTLNDKELWEKCKDAVMGARLTESETAPDIQTGVVVFNFKVK